MFKTFLNLLLLKILRFSKQNYALDDTILFSSEKSKYSKNAAVYQGVLEPFESINSDLFIVFKRQLGFNENLWDLMLFTKKTFILPSTFWCKKIKPKIRF